MVTRSQAASVGPLTTAEYRRLKFVIDRIRAVRHSWSVLVYNCNDFVADVARGMGMQTPATLSLPYDFIPRLQAINERTLVSAAVTQIRQSGLSVNEHLLRGQPRSTIYRLADFPGRAEGHCRLSNARAAAFLPKCQ